MKTFFPFLFLLALVVAAESDVLAQWNHVEGNLPSYGVADAIDACDSLTAVVSVRGYNSYRPLYRTVNGGASWKTIDIPTTFGATDVEIADSLHMWYISNDMRIYGTVDGGATWVKQFDDTAKTIFLDYIEMFSLTDGVAMGDVDAKSTKPVLVMKTTNGGATWTQVNHSSLIGEWSGDVWRRMDFVNANVGFFYASKTGLPYKTTDGGATWTSIPFPAKKTAMVMKFYNEAIGLASVMVDTTCIPWLYRTTDGGASWLLVKPADETGWGNDIEFVPGDPAKVWYTSYAGVFFSQDTGRTWKKQLFDSSNVKARDIVLTSGGYGWIACDNRALYRTTRATALSNIQTAVGAWSGERPTLFLLEQNYPNPFNPSTTIRYTLSQRGDASVTLYSVLGREVAVLAAGEHAPGAHTVVWDASGMAAGVYFCELRTGARSQIMKLILVK